MNFRVLTFLVVALVVSCGASQKKETIRKGRQLSADGTVALVSTAQDTLKKLTVALAADEVSRNSGLMDVFDLSPTDGMLFLFPNEEPQTFWMANTPLALDMLFINKSGEIVRIHTNTQPYSNTTYSSGRPADRVLEVPAGFCAANDIREGYFMYQLTGPVSALE
jgi:uncharacterized membrane protein (UPF0127 family)